MSDTDPEERPGGVGRRPNRASRTGPDGPKKKPRARRTRGIIAWVLIVLASLLIPVSVISVWAIRTVTNTDQYVATMAPLARNPGHRRPSRHQGDRRALLDPHRAEQGDGGAAEGGEADRDADRERGAQLRVRPRAQGLPEPQVRPAVGHAEPAHPRCGHRRPHRQAVAAHGEAREGRRHRRQRRRRRSTT